MPTWESWSGRIELPVNEILAPADLGELIAKVQALDPKLGDRLHAQGSRWAFSAPAYCADFVVATDALNGFPPELQGAINTPLTGDRFRLAVEAGIKIEALYNSLARRAVHPSLPAPRNAPPPGTETWTLPVLGGAGGQSIAGAISTGTHGGDARRPPLSDAVAAMLMVVGHGELRLIQRVNKGAPPIVDVARLSAALGRSVRDFQDDALLDAAVVSAGRFGIVYAYVLELVNEGTVTLIEERTKRSWFDLRAGLFDAPGAPGLISQAVAADRFLQVAFNPSRQPGGDHTCYLTVHRRAEASDSPLPINVLEKRQADGLRPFMQLLCADRITPALETLRIALVAAIPLLAATGGAAVALLPPPLDLLLPAAPLVSAALVGFLVLAADRLGRIGPDYLLGDAVADILNAATDLGIPAIGEMVTGALLDGEQAPWTVSGTRFEIADFFDYDHDCYRGDSVEIFFEVDALLPDKIEQVLSVFDRLRDRGVPFGGYASLRFMARSAAPLALSRWTTTCSIEVAAIRGLRGNMQVMADVQEAARRNGGLVHWGQQNDLDAAAVAAGFGPSLTAWRAKLAAWDTSLLFSNPFTSAHGLEVMDAGAPWGPAWELLGLASQGPPGVGDAGAGQPLTVFARDSRSLINARTRRIDGLADSGWAPIRPEPAAGRPVVRRGVSGRLEVFVFDVELQRIRHTWEIGRPGGVFASWDTLGFLASAPLASDPSVAAHLDGRLEVFARGARRDGAERMAHAWAVFVDSYWSDVVWRGSGAIVSAPGACLRSHAGSDQMAVTAIGPGAGAAGEVRVIQQTGPDGGSGWTEWAEVNPASGPRLAAVGEPVIVAQRGVGAAVHLLALDVRGQLHETTDLLAGPILSWGPWQALPSAVAFDFLATDGRLVTVVSDRIDLFARSQRGAVLTIAFTPGAGWGPWTSLGGETDADLAAGLHEDGRIEIVAREAATGQLRARRQVAPGRW